MPSWLIAIPVWGELYVEQFCTTALPALQRAVHALAAEHGVDVRMVIHTDQPARVRGVIDITIDFRPVPAGAREFDRMSQAHREVLALGTRGDVVVLLTAGAVISERGLCYCADILGNQHLQVVLCAVPRVLSEGRIFNTDDAAAFMAWAWEHRHPMTRECTWPDGRSVDLSRTFFIHGESVYTRQILPHPFAVRIDGRILRFTPTIDANLMQCFDRSEMHMTPDCQQLALVKLTPADKAYDLAAGTMVRRAAAGELFVADPLQRWSMGHRILLCGPGADPGVCGDDQFTRAIRGG